MRKGDEIKENVINLMRLLKLDLRKKGQNVYGVGDNMRFYLKASAVHHPKNDKKYFFDITSNILRHNLTWTDADGKPEHRFVLFCLGYMNGRPERVYAVPSCYLANLANGGKFSESRGQFKLSIEIDDHNNPQHQWIIEDPEQKDLAEYSYSSIEDLIYRICPDEHTALAVDLKEPSKIQRVEFTTFRILRDTRKGRWIKKLYEYKCQVCRCTIDLPNGQAYAEAHHIKPLCCDGPDVEENILCLCPNDHARLDIGASMLDKANLTIRAGHNIGDEYISYHNEQIYTGS